MTEKELQEDFERFCEAERAAQRRKDKMRLIVDFITAFFMGIAAAGAIVQMLQ